MSPAYSTGSWRSATRITYSCTHRTSHHISLSLSLSHAPVPLPPFHTTHRYTHHIVTIALVCGSYYYNFLRIGVVVLYVHDVSDITTDLLKIFNYCKLEGPKGYFLVEGIFAINLCYWFYYRFYLLFTTIYYGIILGAREIASAPHQPIEAICWGKKNVYNLPALPPEARGFPKGWTPGDGSFDLLTNIQVMPTHPCLMLYWPMAFLMILLQCMQILWMYMLLRLLYRIVAAGSPHEAGREVYEGESDEEE